MTPNESLRKHKEIIKPGVIIGQIPTINPQDVKRFRDLRYNACALGKNIQANLLAKLAHTKKLGQNRTMIHETLDNPNTKMRRLS